MLMSMNSSAGFTVPELLVTIVIIGILASISVFVPGSLLPEARDRERNDDVTSIARRLEQAYNAQETGAPTYPTTTTLLADIAASNDTVARLSSDAFKAPGASGSSVVAATSNSLTAPKGAGSPVLGEYVYQPLTSANALCTGSATCVRFFLYYRLEKTSAVITIKSIRQQ